MGDLPSGDPDTTQPSLGAHTTDNQRACGRPRPEAVLLAPAPSQSELWGAGRERPAAHTPLHLTAAQCFCIVLPVTLWLGQGHPAGGGDNKDH